MTFAVGSIVSYGQRGVYVVVRAFSDARRQGPALHDLHSIEGNTNVYARTSLDLRVLPRPDERQTSEAESALCLFFDLK